MSRISASYHLSEKEGKGKIKNYVDGLMQKSCNNSETLLELLVFLFHNHLKKKKIKIFFSYWANAGVYILSHHRSILISFR